MEINKEFIRWALLIGAAPVWLPFLRLLWKDFNDALREEGGLFGAQPTPRELEKIRREKEAEPDTLVSEPWVRPGERRRTRMRAPDGGRRAPRAPDARPGGRGADRGPGRGPAPPRFR